MLNFFWENVEKCIDNVENTLDCAEILTVNKIDEKLQTTAKTKQQ